MEYLKALKGKFSNLSRKEKIFLSILVVGLLVFSLWAGYQLGYSKLIFKDEALSPRGTVVSGKPEEPTNFPNPINGLLFKKSEADSWVNRLPLGVIIENHTEARPQSGLTKADVVYEALAEGGITRLLAIFLQEDSGLGPVRSNRPYYLDWLSEYDGGYAHVGGSPEAQSLVKSYGIKDLDQFSLGNSAYERVGSRRAPHNVYTTTEKLRAAAEKKGYTRTFNIVSWKFLEEKDIPKRKDRPDVFNITLGFRGTYGYDVEWRYNADTNSYFRFNAGAPHLDAINNSQIEAKTIIVKTVVAVSDPSGHSRLKMTTLGSNALKVFANGKATEGTWRKDSRIDRTKFLDSAGNEIKLNRGKIWVEIIPPGSAFTHT